MTAEIHRLQAPRKMKKSKVTPPENQDPDNLYELPLMENPHMTAQELLAKLSRNPMITKVVVIFPTEGDSPDVQHTHVLSSNLENQEINWLCDKAKLFSLGFEV